jgi:hypothetical protein
MRRVHVFPFFSLFGSPAVPGTDRPEEGILVPYRRSGKET